MAGESKNWDKKVILIKVETTEGVDAAPVVGTNAFKVLNYRPTFMDAEQRVRTIEKAFFGADPVAMSAFKRGASFDMEMHGGGTSNGTTPPAWMTLARLCGFAAPVVTGGNSVVQSLTSDVVSGSHWAYIDDLLLKTIGMRGSIGWILENDDYPRFPFTMLGRPPETLAEQSAPGAPTIAGYVDPVLAKTVNTEFTLDGYEVGLRRWEMNSNSDLQYRSLIGRDDRINYRNRSFSGTILCEIPDLTTKNYFSKVRPGSTMPAVATHGVDPGNIVGISTPKLQITGNIEISEEGGKAMMSLPVTALPNVGNDEVQFTTS